MEKFPKLRAGALFWRNKFVLAFLSILRYYVPIVIPKGFWKYLRAIIRNLFSGFRIIGRAPVMTPSTTRSSKDEREATIF